METIITLALSNFTATLLIAGLLAAAIALWRRPRPLTPAVVVEDVFAYYLLTSVGLGYFYNFVMHVFFGDMTARFIGWEQSPFQAEVGMASLGFSVIGFLAFRGNIGLRIAAVVGPGCFLLGAAAGHAYQMITAHNFEPGNAGTVFYTDIALPILSGILLWLHLRLDSASPVVSAEPAGPERKT